MAYVNFTHSKTQEQALTDSVQSGNSGKVYFSSDTTNIIKNGKKYGSIAEDTESLAPQEAQFSFRPTGGGNLPPTGVARIDRIKGKSIVWNQLLNEGKLVDMGLPSGTLWASSNIDVTQPDGFAQSPFQYECSFFSWGNVDWHNPISTSAFDFNFGSVNNAEPWYEGQVYGNTQGNTLTGNIPVGDTYDAARVNSGSLWRIPTSNEFKELVDNSKFIDANGNEIDSSITDKRVTVNGVMGLYLESKINGARLFFSCSGYGYGRTWNYRGASGFYWSSTWLSACDARYLFFYSGGVVPQHYNYRYYGFSLRPVISKSALIVGGNGGHKFALSTNNKNISDVTLMFGAGNEPATVEEFEKMFPLDYYAYNKGTIINNNVEAYETIGFNQWDEQWELGTFNTTTGQNQTILTQIRSKNPIPVLPSTTYYAKTSDIQNSTMWALFLDAGGNIITDLVEGAIQRSGNSFGFRNNQFTTPNNARYMRFYMTVEYGATYNHDICINISNPDRNGAYEPYWKKSLALGLNSFRVTDGTNIITVNGLKSAGSVYNEIDLERKKYIKRVGSVDVGSYDYVKQGNLYTTSGFIPPKANMIFGRGKSIVWNSLFRINSNAAGTYNGVVVTIDNNRVSIVGTNEGDNTSVTISLDSYIITPGHKWLFKMFSSGWGGETNNITVSKIGTGANIYLGGDAAKRIKTIPSNWSGGSWNIRIPIISGKTYNYSFTPQIYDLTLMFGAGNEPATPEEIEAMFPLDYYAYDTGSFGILTNSTYADATVFKAAMQGVMLNYELAEPIEYDLVDDIPDLQTVDDFGTEYAKPTEEVDANGVPKSAPFKADIKYKLSESELSREFMNKAVLTQPQELTEREKTIIKTNLGTDDSVTANSSNLITSGAVYSGLNTKPTVFYIDLDNFSEINDQGLTPNTEIEISVTEDYITTLQNVFMQGYIVVVRYWDETHYYQSTFMNIAAYYSTEDTDVYIRFNDYVGNFYKIKFYGPEVDPGGGSGY